MDQSRGIRPGERWGRPLAIGVVVTVGCAALLGWGGSPSSSPRPQLEQPAGLGATAAGSVVGSVRMSATTVGGPPRLSPYSRARYQAPRAGGGGASLQDVVIYVASASRPRSVAPAMEAVIDQRDLEITPRVTVVTVGSRIDFPNGDLVYHNLFSLSETKRFNLGRYPPGESRTVLFDKPGLVRLFCDIHSDMAATVLVMDHGHFARPDRNGAYEISGLPPGEHTLVAWHQALAPDSVTVTVSESGVTRVDFSLGGPGRMTLTLQQRIWAWCAGITLAALLVFFFIAESSFQSTIRSGVIRDVRAASTLATEVRSSQFDGLIGRTTDFAQDPRLKGVVDTRDPATITQILLDELSVGWMDWFAVLSVDGIPLARTPGAPVGALARADNLLRDAAFYDTGDLWVTDEGIVDVSASPILFGSAPMGILVGGRQLDQAGVADIESYVRQRVAILADGRVAIGDAQLWAAALAAPLRLPEDEVGVFVVDGEEFFGMESPLVDAAGRPVASMLIFQSLEAALAPARRLRLTLLGVASIALALAFLLALVLSRTVTAPVNRLLGEAQRLGEGDLEHPILPMRRDEIGKLAEGFDLMRASLRDAQKELIRSERLSVLGQMAGSIVHDFANPLAAIRMNAQLMQMDAPGTSDPSATTDIVEQVDRLDAMMREVLEFARGDRSLDRSHVDVRAWLCELERFWRPLLASHRVGLQVSHGYEGGWTFDPARLRRVVDNLVKNALGAVVHEGTIVVRALRSGDTLRIEIADDGRGIPPEIQDTLFQPFATHGKKDGTGLGLAICKNVVERHGGRIDFVSTPVGTTFIILLPGEDAACIDAA